MDYTELVIKPSSPDTSIQLDLCRCRSGHSFQRDMVPVRKNGRYKLTKQTDLKYSNASTKSSERSPFL
jgi:hypothetical protein